VNSQENKTGLRRSGTLAAASVTASALVTICALAATALILRALSRAEAGRFALLVELLYALGLLGSLGQAMLQARLYQHASPGHFDWLADLRATIGLTLPVVVLAVFAIAIPYGLTSSEIAFLCAGSELYVLINCVSAILAQQQRYVWSSALLRLPNGLLIIPVAMMLINRSWLGLQFALASFLFLLALTVAFSVWLLADQRERGRARITFKQRLPGLIFLVGVLGIVATQRGMITVAGAIVPPERVASLAALLVLLRVFDLIGEPSGRVFSTEMARDPRAINRGLLAAPWLIAGILSLGLLALLPPLARHFYAGRYDAALPLLPWLVVAGALRFVEIVPRGAIFYLASTRSLNGFAIVQSVVAVVGLAIMVQWTQSYDLHGTVWAGAMIAAVRVAVSYFFFARIFRRNRESSTSTDDLLIKPVEIGGEEPPV
jgi:hypothetical protein